MHICEKRKMTSLIFATIILFGVIIITMSQPVKAYAAPTNSSSVGAVDYIYLINRHPDASKSNEILRANQEQAKKEFTEKAGSLSDKEKQDLDRQLGQRVEEKRQELLKPIVDKVNAAVKLVQVEMGLTIVVQKSIVVSGGTDITEEVMKKIIGK